MRTRSEEIDELVVGHHHTSEMMRSSEEERAKENNSLAISNANDADEERDLL